MYHFSKSLCQANVRIGSSLSISDGMEVKSITVYNFSGSRIGSIRCSGKTVSVPLSSVNIMQEGIYLLHIETEEGIVKRKIIVR